MGEGNERIIYYTLSPKALTGIQILVRVIVGVIGAAVGCYIQKAYITKLTKGTEVRYLNYPVLQAIENIPGVSQIINIYEGMFKKSASN